MPGSRIGVMGGTFDPIHHGHLVAASEVAGLFALDEVVFVPTGQPWQKSGREVSPAEDRYLMTVIATASNPRFSVSRVDIDRGGPTYTIDTLTDLRTQRPDADLFFITGADALSQILSWRDSDRCFELAHFIGVTRPGFTLGDAHLPHGVVSLVEVPALAISSTDCRDRVVRGRPVWYLVPDGVVQYIEKRGLYRDGQLSGAAAPGLPASRPAGDGGGALADRAATNRTATDRADGDRADGNRADGDRADGDRADGNRADGDRPGAGRPPGDRPTYDRAPGSAARAGGPDDPTLPPRPHLREVPR